MISIRSIIIVKLLFIINISFAIGQPQVNFPNSDAATHWQRKYAFVSKGFPIELISIENYKIETNNGVVFQDTIIDFGYSNYCVPAKIGKCKITVTDTVNNISYSGSINIVDTIKLGLRRKTITGNDGTRVYYSIIDLKNGKEVTKHYRTGYFIVKWIKPSGEVRSAAINSLDGYFSISDFSSSERFMSGDNLQVEVGLWNKELDLFTQNLKGEIMVE